MMRFYFPARPALHAIRTPRVKNLCGAIRRESAAIPVRAFSARNAADVTVAAIAVGEVEIVVDVPSAVDATVAETAAVAAAVPVSNPVAAAAQVPVPPAAVPGQVAGPAMAVITAAIKAVTGTLLRAARN